MSEKFDKIAEILAPIATGLSLEYVGLEYGSGPHEVLLRIYLDKPGGITLDDCARASRQMNAALSVETILPERYRLEVSSPGLDRPLFTKAHYDAVLGKTLECRLIQAKENRRNWTGILTKVEEMGCELKTEQGPVTLLFSEIQKANVKSDIGIRGK